MDNIRRSSIWCLLSDPNRQGKSQLVCPCCFGRIVYRVPFAWRRSSRVAKSDRVLIQILRLSLSLSLVEERLSLSLSVDVMVVMAVVVVKFLVRENVAVDNHIQCSCC